VWFTCRGAVGGEAPPLQFAPGAIDADGGQVTNSLDTGDLDGDLLPDVVVAGDARLVWYRNPDWSAHEIARGRYGAGAMTVVRDLDGDGRLDVVTGERVTLETVWFRNGPAGWERHLMTASAYSHDLAFGDLDGDGRADAACTDQHHARDGRRDRRPRRRPAARP
jgi:hypothetical protein